MRKVNIAMMILCLLMGVFLIVLFVYSIVALREIDPIVLLYVVAAGLTARVFWKRANATAPGQTPLQPRSELKEH